MKLRYDLEIMAVGDDYVAVPVGPNSNQLQATIELNGESKRIIELIKESESPDQILEKLCQLYPDESKNELGQQLCEFLNQLIKEGLLIP